jgi:ectoine hydroxylase-related dioxygenase (phytanoyl-CoA dioxygenase family)
VFIETSPNCNSRENLGVSLSEDDLRSLLTSGFVTVTAISTMAEVAEMRRIFADLIARRVGAKAGLLFDNMESETSPDGRRSIQLTNPSKYQSWLLDTTYVRNATRIAHQVLSPKSSLTFDFVLLKPAGVGAGTPWHQDEAYLDPKYDHSTLTFWMPLQDVDASDGCMSYLPGSHLRGVLEHRSVHGDRHAHAFECTTTVPQEESVVCPLPAGGCAIHGQRIMHSSSNNTSSVDRYAYILTFGIPPALSKNPRKAPWLEQRRSKEGAIRLLFRKAQKIRFLAPSVYLLNLKRRLNAIFGDHP